LISLENPGQNIRAAFFFKFYFFAVSVIHHGLRRVDKALLIGDTVEHQGHEWCRILPQAPCDPPQQDEPVHRVKIGIGVVAGGGAEDPALAGGVGAQLEHTVFF